MTQTYKLIIEKDQRYVAEILSNYIYYGKVITLQPKQNKVTR